MIRRYNRTKKTQNDGEQVHRYNGEIVEKAQKDRRYTKRADYEAKETCIVSKCLYIHHARYKGTKKRQKENN